MSFTRTSPTVYGAVPAAVTDVGGVVLDLVGTSGVRLVAQLPASSLFEGFFGSTIGTIGTLPGITQEVITALGGGLSEVAVRITVQDADTASGNFDFNQNWLRLSGTRIDNFSDVTTVRTDSLGNVTAAERLGFGNNTLDTGWFYSDEAVTLDAVFATLQSLAASGGALAIELEDVDPGDNFFDFTQGIDGSLIDIGSFNVVPVANDDAVTVTEDDGPTAIDARANDVDTGPFDITEIDGVAQPAIVTLASGATLTRAASGDVLFDQNGAYQYLRTDEQAVETVIYRVTDPQGNTDTASITITIEGADDAPDLADDAFTLTEDDASVSGNLFADNGAGADVDVDAGATFQITAINGQAGLVGGQFALGGGLVTVGADGGFLFETNGGYDALAEDGSDVESFTYTVTDDDGLTSTATVAVTVTGVNDPPTAVDDTAETLSDATAAIAPLANDEDPENLPLAIVAFNGVAYGGGTVALPSGARLLVDAATPGGFLYDPDGAFDLAKDERVEDSFTYTIADSEGVTSTATVTVGVTGPNVAPVAGGDAATVAEEGSVRIDVLANDSDADPADTLTTQLVDGPDNGVVVRNGDGSFTYVPVADFFGTDSFTYSLSDGDESDTATVTVTVTNTPDDPEPQDDNVSAEHDTPVTFDPRANDIEVDGEALTIVGVGAASDGTVSFDGSSVTYTPLSGFIGADSFTYTVEDPTGRQATAEITVDVAPGPLPDLVVEAASLPGGAGEARVLATWTLGNIGPETATETIIERLWLSRDGTLDAGDTLLRTLSFGGDLDPGASIARSATVTLPDAPGGYRLIVELDGDEAILEEDETNNTLASAPLTVTADYTAEITAAPGSAAAGETFTVTGRATDTATGAGEAFEFVTVEVETGGVARSFSAFTDADGFFSLDVATLPGSAGTTLINARHPGVPGEDAAAEATVAVYGMDFTVGSQFDEVIEGQTTQVTLTLENLSELGLTGLDFSLVDVDPALTVTFAGPLPTELAGDGSATITLDVTAADDAPIIGDFFDVRVTSDEGAAAETEIAMDIIDLLPRLQVTEGDLFTTMLLGQQSFATVEITNVGGDETGDLDILLPPGFDFLRVVTPDLPSLAPGESIDVTFSLRPDADLPFGQYGGSMVVTSTDVSLNLPFEFTTTSSETGTLDVSLVSEATFLTAEADKVDEATVTVRDYFTGAVVAQATDVDGDVSFSDLPAGFYRVSISAEGHDSTQSTVEVLPGRTVELESFMSEQTVAYSWRVEEIEVEDRYIVEVESTFTANVPQAVVVLDPLVIDVFDLQEIGDVKTVDLTITNHGLITAENLSLDLGSHPWYEITPLIDGLDELGAQSSVTIPVRIERTGDFAPGAEEEEDLSGPVIFDGGVAGAEPEIVDAGTAEGSGIIPCIINGILNYEFPCGGFTVAKALGISYANVDGNCSVPFTLGRIPPGGGGPGGTFTGGGPGGGGTPVASVVPAVSVTELCDFLRVIFDCKALVPLPPHIDLALDVLEFLTFGPDLGAPEPEDPEAALEPTLAEGEELPVDTGPDLARRPSLGDIRDGVDGGLGVLGTIGDAATCATAVGNFLGNETLTNAGEAVNDAVDQISDPLQTISDILNAVTAAPEPGEEAASGFSPAFEAAFADVETAYADLQAALAGLADPGDILGIMGEIRALRDALQDLVDTGELDPAQADLFETTIDDLRGVLFEVDQVQGVFVEAISAGADLQLLLEIGEVVYGDDVWVQYITDLRVQSFLGDFFDFMAADAGGPTLLSAANEATLRAYALPTEITQGDITALIETWEARTAEGGTVDPASQVFQDAQELQRLLEDYQEAELAALEAGFLSLDAFINARLSTADDTANGLNTPAAGEACAQVRLSIEQEVALTRQGFQGTLVIDNFGGEPLTDLEVVLQIRDSDGLLVDENVFGIFDPELDGITAIDGTGTLAAGTEGSVAFTILPSRLAAPEGETNYTIGGTLSYSENGRTLRADLTPEPVTVLPQPELELKYFQSRDVIADDPFTPEIEDSVPFSLGVRVSNVGPGAATDLSITSAQPEIIDNDKGLLVDFEIIGTEVNGASLRPSLLADFGDIAPGETGLAVWKLQSSLQGVFSDYSASFEHVNGLGIEELSLITDVTIHELIQVVDAGSPSADDGLPDFLVNDVVDAQSLPDTVYFSEGGDAPVVIGSGATQSVGVTTATIAITHAGGWVYTRLDDPLGEFDRIDSLERIEIDGGGNEVRTIVAIDNVWQTDRTFTDGGVAVIGDKLHLFDYLAAPGTTTYEITFTDVTPNAAPVARDDAFSGEAGSVISGNLFADNGSGADTDLDGDPLSVATLTVDGTDYAIGDGPIALSGGRVLTVQANGDFTFDTGTFYDDLVAGGPRSDSFTYTATDTFLTSGPATVELTISSAVDEETGLGRSDVWRGEVGVAETFTLGAGEGDQLRNFEIIDTLDVRDWGVQSFEELRIFDRDNLLTIQDLVTGTFAFAWDRDNLDPAAGELTADNFIFAPVQGLTITEPQKGTTLHGRAGGDILEAGPGFKNLIGGGGADRFVMLQDSRGIIRDFEDGTDLIDVTDWGVESFDDLTILEFDLNIVVKAPGESLRIDKAVGVTLGDIDASDFYGF